MWSEAPSRLPCPVIHARADGALGAARRLGADAEARSRPRATRASSAGACGPAALSVQMVWEKGCVVIVMLTPLSENGVKQCHPYWPDEGSSLYHVYEVLSPSARPAPLS